MDTFNALPNEERQAALEEAAAQMGVEPVIIEKDFWVCWTLQQLYSLPEIAPHITFKGGTSLSKAYGLIERFSEDIDLVISKDALGIKDFREANISNNEYDRRIKAVRKQATVFVTEHILPQLQQRIADKLGQYDNRILEIDSTVQDQQTLLFYYPRILNYKQGANFSNMTFGKSNFANDYIKPHIKLEFGARGDKTPNTIKTVSPYLHNHFPTLFTSPESEVPVLTAERTFWEKVTIFHALNHNSKETARLSRHYYDVYCMSKKGTAEDAIAQEGLLDEVVINKMTFYGDPKASYETAKIGTLKLTPHEALRLQLQRDYTDMQEMFFNEAPTFESVMDEIERLEKRINSP